MNIHIKRILAGLLCLPLFYIASFVILFVIHLLPLLVIPAAIVAVLYMVGIMVLDTLDDWRNEK